MSQPLAHVELVAGIVRGRHAEVAERIDTDPSVLEGFPEFAEHHRLAGFLWRELDATPLAERLPAACLAPLRAFYLRQWSKNERLVREAAALAPAVLAAAPDAIFLKGPFFAVRYYGDVDRRAISDLDVLVFDRAAVARVGAVLDAAGYRRTRLPAVSRALVWRFAHHDIYRRGDLAVELHWALKRHFSFRIDYDAVRSGAVACVLRGQRYAVAGDEYELVLQILAAFGDAQAGRFRLKTIVDLYKHLRATDGAMDWPRFLAARQREGLLRIAVNVLAMALDVLDCAAEFPALAAALARYDAERRVRGRRAALAFLDAAPFDLAGKFRTFALYDAPWALCMLAWAGSLPIRLAVHREGAARTMREVVGR